MAEDKYIGNLGEQGYEVETLYAEYAPQRLTGVNWRFIIAVVTCLPFCLGVWWFIVHKLFGR